MEWKNILRGFAMGVADLIPGVSGGTIAVVLGIYDRLIAAISGFFSKEWKKHALFLIPLGIGMVVTILSLSRVIDFLLENYYAPTQFFFLGLIIGVVPMLFRELHTRAGFKSSYWVAILIGTILVASMAFIRPSEAGLITNLSAGTTALLFFSGWLASMAMLLPGISGSFILLLIGVYPTAIRALSDLNIPLILIIGAGVGVGFIVSSKIIRYLLANKPGITFAVIIGLVLGSLAVVFPGLPENGTQWILSFVTFAAGWIIVHLLNRVSA